MEMISARIVQRMLGISRGTLFALRKRKGFPVPVALAGISLRWEKQEILDWVARQPRGKAMAHQVILEDIESHKDGLFTDDHAICVYAAADAAHEAGETEAAFIERVTEDLEPDSIMIDLTVRDGRPIGLMAARQRFDKIVARGKSIGRWAWEQPAGEDE